MRTTRPHFGVRVVRGIPFDVEATPSNLRLLAGCAALIAVGAPLPGVAQDPAPASPSEAYERTRQDMLDDLDNPAKALRFAEAAVDAGDVRGAIAALERILTLDPTLTNIRFELGLLYLRAGSPEIGRIYLREVVEAEETPDHIRERAVELLAQSDAQLARHRVSGAVTLAARYETNANAAPESVLIAGAPGTILDEEDEPQGDISAVFDLELEHSYDFGNQRGDALATELDLFAARYRDVESSNAAFARLASGPEFNFATGSVRPYLGASTLALEDERYRDTAFVGLEVGWALSQNTYLFAQGEGRFNEFIDSDANPLASRRDGHEGRGSLTLSHALRPDVIASATLFGGVFDADASFESNDWLGAAIGLRWSVANPIGADLEPAVIRGSASYGRFEYEEPNPFIDPDQRQVDDRVDLRASLNLPIRAQWSLETDIDFVDNQSTLPNDEFDNLRVSFGLRYEFGARP